MKGDWTEIQEMVAAVDWQADLLFDHWFGK
jgi:hypothetical protein